MTTAFPWNHQVEMGEIHAHIHAGRIHEVTAIGSAVANNADLNILIQTQSGRPCHMRFEAAGGADARVRLYEAVGVDANSLGSGLTPRNRNRVSALTAVSTFTRDAAVGSFGTQLEDQMIFGGGAILSNGVSRAEFEEWILAAGQSYLYRITNVSGGAQSFSIHLMFYEPI